MKLCINSNDSRIVTREELTAVPTPEATRTWQPVPHWTALAQVLEALPASGFRVLEEQHGVSHSGHRYFGLLTLGNCVQHEDYQMVLGVRNSHDKSFPYGLVCGSNVFVCDNLCFSGEVRVQTKHTRWIMDRLPGLVHKSMAGITKLRDLQDQRIDAYKGTELGAPEVHDFLVRSLKAKVIPAAQLPKVLGQWESPSHEDFEPRTAWSLMNAYTEVWKGTNTLTLPERSMKLHGMLDSQCGVLSHAS